MVAETLQEILTRFERKVASAGDDNNRAGQGAKPHLLPWATREVLRLRAADGARSLHFGRDDG